jgi:hypothetical protein
MIIIWKIRFWNTILLGFQVSRWLHFCRETAMLELTFSWKCQERTHENMKPFWHLPWTGWVLLTYRLADCAVSQNMDGEIDAKSVCPSCQTEWKIFSKLSDNLLVYLCIVRLYTYIYSTTLFTYEKHDKIREHLQTTVTCALLKFLIWKVVTVAIAELLVPY